MSTKIHRKKLTHATARLRRARGLYVFLCRHALRASTNDDVLLHMSERMMAEGLYAKRIAYRNAKAQTQQSRDYRYRIARWLFNIERGSCGQAKPGEWTTWLRHNGFNWNFHKVCAKGQMEEYKVG